MAKFEKCPSNIYRSCIRRCGADTLQKDSVCPACKEKEAKAHNKLLKGHYSPAPALSASQAADRTALLENALREARELLLDYQLGHPHDAKQEHIRVMGDTYGWCDFCQEKVCFEEDPAKKMVAAIDAVLGSK